MARAYKCVCKICGKNLTTDKAHKIVSNGKNNYYCSQDEYVNWINKKNADENEKKYVYELIQNVLGDISNSYLFKELNELHNKYSYKLMGSYLAENEDYISRSMNKQFVNSYAKIKYFMAILKNNIVDYEIPIEEVKYVEHEITETKFKSRNKRRSLQEIEQEALNDIE